MPGNLGSLRSATNVRRSARSRARRPRKASGTPRNNSAVCGGDELRDYAFEPFWNWSRVEKLPQRPPGPPQRGMHVHGPRDRHAGAMLEKSFELRKQPRAQSAWDALGTAAVTRRPLRAFVLPLFPPAPSKPCGPECLAPLFYRALPARGACVTTRLSGRQRAQLCSGRSKRPRMHHQPFNNRKEKRMAQNVPACHAQSHARIAPGRIIWVGTPGMAISECGAFPASTQYCRIQTDREEEERRGKLIMKRRRYIRANETCRIGRLPMPPFPQFVKCRYAPPCGYNGNSSRSTIGANRLSFVPSSQVSQRSR